MGAKVGPSTVRMRTVGCLDPRVPLPAKLVSFLVKKVAGTGLHLLARAARRIHTHPAASPHAARLVASSTCRGLFRWDFASRTRQTVIPRRRAELHVAYPLSRGRTYPDPPPARSLASWRARRIKSDPFYSEWLMPKCDRYYAAQGWPQGVGVGRKPRSSPSASRKAHRGTVERSPAARSGDGGPEASSGDSDGDGGSHGDGNDDEDEDDGDEELSGWANARMDDELVAELSRGRGTAGLENWGAWGYGGDGGVDGSVGSGDHFFGGALSGVLGFPTTLSRSASDLADTIATSTVVSDSVASAGTAAWGLAEPLASSTVVSDSAASAGTSAWGLAEPLASSTVVSDSVASAGTSAWGLAGYVATSVSSTAEALGTMAGLATTAAAAASATTTTTATASPEALVAPLIAPPTEKGASK